MSRRPTSSYVCPVCRAALDVEELELYCPRCSRHYPLDDGIADFSQGLYYDAFEPGCPLSEEATQGLSDEFVGTRARIAGFYLDRLERVGPRQPGAPVRVLDCGCGNGLSVDLLAERSFEAWGNDLSRLRKWQWRERTQRDHLFVCDGSTLPFPDGFFDAVIAAGILEHIGVTETGSPHYSVAPRPDRDEARKRFLGELLRIVTPGGRIWLDFPNGLFPIDFWHGTGISGMRFHTAHEGFLPTVSEVRGYLAALGSGWRVDVSSPARRLAFRRARRHWYGKALWIPTAAFFWLLTRPLFRGLAASALNPYLVLEISRSR